jgi:predicted ferric reductase
MSQKNDSVATIWPPSARLGLGIVLAALTAAILFGAPTIALRAFPDELAQYGLPAAWMVATGQICGLLAGTLALLQFALSAKLKFLDRIFGMGPLFSLHRVLGVYTVVLASLHPVFIFSPRAIEIGALRLEIWPVLVGAVLLIGLWTAVCTGLWREFLQLPYARWYRFHRVGAFGAIVLLTLHVLAVTDTFHGGLPLYALIVGLSLYAALFVWTIGIKPTLLKGQTYSVTKVAPAGKETHAVELSRNRSSAFAYAPGQFAFVTFHSEALPVERHPWTISSTPTRPESLIFTIKCTGDFTALIGRLKSGDTATVDGPYGLFSYQAKALEPDAEIVMIAGGVGITPMLSMLRYMGDMGETRKVTLVWSNKTEADILCRDELETIKDKLPGFTCSHVLTRQKDYRGPSGRLDDPLLRDLLSECSHDAPVFLCGPPAMMRDVRNVLRRIGFAGRRIYTERFSI